MKKNNKRPETHRPKINITIPLELKNDLEALSKETGISISRMLTEAGIWYIDKTRRQQAILKDAEKFFSGRSNRETFSFEDLSATYIRKDGVVSKPVTPDDIREAEQMFREQKLARGEDVLDPEVDQIPKKTSGDPSH